MADMRCLYDEVYAKHLEMKDQIDKKTSELEENEAKLREELEKQSEDVNKDVVLMVDLEITRIKLTLATLNMKHMARQKQLNALDSLIKSIE